jgi:hypothetical protein
VVFGIGNGDIFFDIHFQGHFYFREYALLQYNMAVQIQQGLATLFFETPRNYRGYRALPQPFPVFGDKIVTHDEKRPPFLLPFSGLGDTVSHAVGDKNARKIGIFLQKKGDFTSRYFSPFIAWVFSH